MTMRWHWVDGMIASIVIWAAGTLFPLAQASTQVPGELLVKWQGGPAGYAAAVGNALIGSIVRANYEEIGWQLVHLPDGLSVSDGLRAYKELSTVLAVEPNTLVSGPGP